MVLWETSASSSHSADFMNKASIPCSSNSSLKFIGLLYSGDSQVAQWVKNLPAVGDADSICCLGKSPGGRHSNPLQDSILARTIPWTDELGRLQSRRSQESYMNEATEHKHSKQY